MFSVLILVLTLASPSRPFHICDVTTLLSPNFLQDFLNNYRKVVLNNFWGSMNIATANINKSPQLFYRHVQPQKRWDYRHSKGGSKSFSIDPFFLLLQIHLELLLYICRSAESLFQTYHEISKALKMINIRKYSQNSAILSYVITLAQKMLSKLFLNNTFSLSNLPKETECENYMRQIIDDLWRCNYQ